jgi:hypothetical protein
MTTIVNDSATLRMADWTMFCRRTGQEFKLSEHAECAYCFGTIEEIAAGEPGEFCDFRAGADPREAGYSRPDPAT